MKYYAMRSMKDPNLIVNFLIEAPGAQFVSYNWSVKRWLRDAHGARFFASVEYRDRLIPMTREQAEALKDSGPNLREIAPLPTEEQVAELVSSPSPSPPGRVLPGG